MVRIALIRMLGGLMWLLAIAAPKAALADLSVICDRAAIGASQATGVPLSVLKAIALTETGRKRAGEMRPWPWTVNMEGKGAWFETEPEALAHVYEHFKRGARSFDVGCFQINFRWHGQNFSSIEEMFQPDANAQYAARFLRDLYNEFGSWDAAAGAFHSRTPEYANRYRARFETFRARFLAEDGTHQPLPDLPVDYAAAGPVVRAPRVNTYPLLMAGGGGAMGSLVSVSHGAGASLGGLVLASGGARPLFDAGELP